MITSLLFMVPVHLGTVLFALASASPQVVAEKLRFVLRVSLLIGLPVMAVLAIGAHFLLGVFDSPKNHDIYTQLGTVPLWLLVIGYIPQMPRAQFIAVSRATNRVGQAAGLICFFACCEIASIYVGGKLGGLDGLSFAYLGVLIMEGLITAPTVLRAAYAVTATAAATGAFPAVPAEARATGALARTGAAGPGHRRARQADRLLRRAAGRTRPAGGRPRRPARHRLGGGRLRRAHARRGDRGLARPAHSRRSRPTPPGRGKLPRAPPPAMTCSAASRPRPPASSVELPATAAGGHRRAPRDGHPGGPDRRTSAASPAAMARRR